jgi:hypothetical protein
MKKGVSLFSLAALLLGAITLLSAAGNSEELYKTWINARMQPQKTVNFPGGYKDYLLASDATPSAEGNEQILSKWTDSEGDVWYKTFGTLRLIHRLECNFERSPRKAESMWSYQLDLQNGKMSEGLTLEGDASRLSTSYWRSPLSEPAANTGFRSMSRSCSCCSRKRSSLKSLMETDGPTTRCAES